MSQRRGTPIPPRQNSTPPRGGDRQQDILYWLQENAKDDYDMAKSWSASQSVPSGDSDEGPAFSDL